MQTNFKTVGAIVLVIVILTTIRRRYIIRRERNRVMAWKQPTLSTHIPPTATTSVLMGADHGTREMLRQRNIPDYRTGIIKTLPSPPVSNYTPIAQNPFFIPELNV